MYKGLGCRCILEDHHFLTKSRDESELLAENFLIYSILSFESIQDSPSILNGRLKQNLTKGGIDVTTV